MKSAANVPGLRAAAPLMGRVGVARGLHQTSTVREAAPQRQVAQTGSNQLSLETPRNTVGMYLF